MTNNQRRLLVKYSHPFLINIDEIMKNVIFLGAFSALGTGIFIGMQSLLSGKAGNLIGSINTGFWTNFLGGSLAGLLILGVSALRGFDSVRITQAAFGMVLVSGLLGILIIMGVSFSIARAGVAAGLAAIIWGQMTFGILADTFGWGGMAPISLDLRRIVGLLVMVVAILLLMPRQ